MDDKFKNAELIRKFLLSEREKSVDCPIGKLELYEMLQTLWQLIKAEEKDCSSKVTDPKIDLFRIVRYYNLGDEIDLKSLLNSYFSNPNPAKKADLDVIIKNLDKEKRIVDLWNAVSIQCEEKTVNNSWLLYDWVGKCFGCVFRGEGHPFESRDGSYVEYYNIDLAINNFMQTEDVFTQIIKSISNRKPKQEDDIIYYINKLNMYLENCFN